MHTTAVKLYFLALQIEENAKQRSRIWVNIGAAWQEIDFRREAFSAYTKALTYNNTDPQIWYNLGTLSFYLSRECFSLGNFLAAFDWCKKTVIFWSIMKKLAPGRYYRAEQWVDDYNSAQKQNKLMNTRLTKT
uniref:Photosystem I assembly protein Ycf3 n=1 Tax=Chromera velia TaxID=505693 RepID=D9IXJ9_9ALVE|nr:photosystem I assembly protein Ycf3 [Chromera velia]ADJ66527.1 photosystem I assembly protein Ycf3 [Chromera velia]